MLTIPLILAAMLTTADPGPKITLTPPQGDTPRIIMATGLSPEVTRQAESLTGEDKTWAKILSVVVAEGTPEEIANRPPLLGTYRFSKGAIEFTPRFPFAPGVPYRAILHDGNKPTQFDFTIPKPKTEPAVITAVYPSPEKIPENTLRFYVQFSQPMTRGGVYEHITLMNDTDKTPVDIPFLELDEELWSLDRTRLTLLIDPGRIKRGVRPLEEVGPALETGKSYRLMISAAMKNAEGQPMKANFEKRYTVSPPIREGIDHLQWDLEIPTGDKPLTITAERPLDHALFGRMVKVTGPGGLVLDRPIVLAGEKTLRFAAPKGGWKSGTYQITIDTRLEDVSGNRVGEPFEVDVFKPVERTPTVETVTRTFRIP